ncbi:response regulator [Phenylobacterium aquaticum]|uniref:response regulator n=1 Tax=Phenylobacterium aquaticum TaxID=1763816 RepID=UPI0026F37070|nr:response regulator [Phenylobacterium aquaticum]
MATILIVEDEVFIRQNAEWTIEDLGHSPLTASDLSGALLHLSGGEGIDALFVDIRLGSLPLGGYDIANRALNIRPMLPVLYTSGTPLNAEMSALFVEGGQFLQKPYSVKDLQKSVDALLATEPR